MVRKELRSLVPFLALVLFFTGLDLLFFLFSDYPDQYPLEKLLTNVEEGGEQVTFLIAFALASGLLVRERDEGTLAFLDALPVSRSRVFVTKTVLAVCLLWLIPLLDLVLRGIVYAWSRTSLEHSLQWHILLTSTALSMLSCVIYFSIGLALSFLRQFSLLALGLLFCAYLWLASLQAPYIGLLNIFSLSAPNFEGQRWLLPIAKLTVQLSLAAACISISFFAFHAMGDVSQRLASRTTRSRGFMLIGAAGTALGILVWILLGVRFIAQSTPDHTPVLRFRETPKIRAHTEHYRFTYADHQAGIVRQLLPRVDPIELKVRQFLGAKPTKSVEADLTGSAPHTYGVAHWKNVQMDLDSVGNDPEEIAAVLAHETTHVYIDLESDSKLSDEFNSTRFFHEGLATYVEYRLFRPPDELAKLRRPAAVARKREQVRLRELIQDSTFSAKYDPFLVYPLGEAFVAGLVRRYGTEAPGQIIRAFARPNAPKDLTGLELWRDVMQSCGFNLGEVENAFLSELDDTARAEEVFVGSLPRLRGAISHQEGKIRIRATYLGSPAGQLLCTFKARENTPSTELLHATRIGSDSFEIDTAFLSERTFYYQLGWDSPKSSQPIYELWMSAPVR